MGDEIREINGTNVSNQSIDILQKMLVSLMMSVRYFLPSHSTRNYEITEKYKTACLSSSTIT